jgi:NAD(P)-dependent dehydrogenase (short-subunit alcohol dehydrogenase family)
MRSAARGVAALLAGAALGVAAAAGTALLLYTGQGFLRAAGLLVSSTIMAVAAGVWAGAPEPTDGRIGSRGRWVAVIIALLTAGAFSALWNARPALREAASGGALSVLLIIALPAYTAGALLVALNARAQVARGSGVGGSGVGGSGVAAVAVAGTAIGVLLATTFMIQMLEPWGIYYGAAGVLTLVSFLEAGGGSAARTGAADMHGKVALITGVGHAGQLGFTIAQAFRAAGARLIVTGRSGEVEQLAAQLGSGDDVYALRADLSSDEDAAHLAEIARERFGRLDVLVNVAGGLRVIRPLADTTPDEWRSEMERNAETVLRMSRAALPLLRESRGAIVNFASPAGLRAAAGIGAYSAAKAAVVAITRSLALEEKEHGVRVNAVAPGMIDTTQNRGDAGAESASSFVPREDVANVALFLASAASAGISGETIHVMGPTLD